MTEKSENSSKLLANLVDTENLGIGQIRSIPGDRQLELFQSRIGVESQQGRKDLNVDLGSSVSLGSVGVHRDVVVAPFEAEHEFTEERRGSFARDAECQLHGGNELVLDSIWEAVSFGVVHSAQHIQQT